MNSVALAAGVDDAEARLGHALARLRRAQLEALLGLHYDDVELDQLIWACRRARNEALAVRGAWQQRQQRPRRRGAQADPLRGPDSPRPGSRPEVDPATRRPPARLQPVA